MAQVINVDKKDAALILADHFESVTYSDLPADVISTVKKSILDTLGVSIAASSLAPGCMELVEVANDGGGKEESTILVFGGRVPAPMAAFANGGMAHGLDFDDIDHEGPGHPSGSVIPAAFAIAERIGCTSGKDFLTAVALGQDMVMRMQSSINRGAKSSDDWLRAGVVGIFAGTAACCKLLKLDKKKIHSALGITLCYTAGAGQLRYSDLRGFYDSWASQGSVFSTLIAAKGISGPPDPLDGDKGFFNIYYRGEYDQDILLTDLGKKFLNTRTGYKPWPSCARSHPCIDAALGLMRGHNLHYEDIEEIDVQIGTHARVNCEPLDYMRNPKTILEAKFSVPFTLAIACVKNRVALTDYTQEAIRDPEVMRFAQKVVPVIDPTLNAKHGVAPASIITIKTISGAKHSKRTDFAYGHYRNPMNIEAIIDKFKNCTSYSAKPLPLEKIQKVVDLVQKLEEVNDVGEIIRLLS